MKRDWNDRGDDLLPLPPWGEPVVERKLYELHGGVHEDLAEMEGYGDGVIVDRLGNICRVSELGRLPTITSRAKPTLRALTVMPVPRPVAKKPAPKKKKAGFFKRIGTGLKKVGKVTANVVKKAAVPAAMTIALGPAGMVASASSRARNVFATVAKWTVKQAAAAAKAVSSVAATPIKLAARPAILRVAAELQRRGATVKDSRKIASVTVVNTFKRHSNPMVKFAGLVLGYVGTGVSGMAGDEVVMGRGLVIGTHGSVVMGLSGAEISALSAAAAAAVKASIAALIPVLIKAGIKAAGNLIAKKVAPPPPPPEPESEYEVPAEEYAEDVSEEQEDVSGQMWTNCWPRHR